MSDDELRLPVARIGFPKVEFSAGEKEILALLASTKRVDMRWLRDEDKVRIKSGLDELHNGKKISLLQISKEVGKSYCKIWGLCRALQVPTRTVGEADRNSAEARSRHRKTPFDGSDEDRAYMLGFTHGDLTVQQVSSLAVFVSSSTTHPAFARLFRELFTRYGPVYQYPMHEVAKDYKWKLAVRLDNSFQFLLQSPLVTLKDLGGSRSLFLHWLAGLLDSDGTVNLTKNNGYTRLLLALHNEDLSLLNALKKNLQNLGYHPTGPYRTFERGDVTPLGIQYKSDMWSLQVERALEARNLLSELPVRHGEKVIRKALALSIDPGTRWDRIKSRTLATRKCIDDEVDAFVEHAKEEYLARRPGRPEAIQ